MGDKRTAVHMPLISSCRQEGECLFSERLGAVHQMTGFGTLDSQKIKLEPKELPRGSNTQAPPNRCVAVKRGRSNEYTAPVPPTRVSEADLERARLEYMQVRTHRTLCCYSWILLYCSVKTGGPTWRRDSNVRANVLAKGRYLRRVY